MKLITKEATFQYIQHKNFVENILKHISKYI